MWSLQYASCLFANKSWKRAWGHLKPGASPNLALLGSCVSVATPQEEEESYQFLKRCAASWDHVFLVPGPLEFTSTPIKRVLLPDQKDKFLKVVERATSKSKGPSTPLKWMEQGEYIFEEGKVVVLGTPLWSDLEGGATPAPSQQEEASIFVYNYYGNRSITPEGIRKLHADDMQWLQSQVTWWGRHRPEYRVVILTHTLCSYNLLSHGLPDATYRRLSYDFLSFSKAERVLQQPHVAAWLCGATGSCTSGMIRPHVFAATNGLYSSGVTNLNYLPNRVLELSA